MTTWINGDCFPSSLCVSSSFSLLICLFHRAQWNPHIVLYVDNLLCSSSHVWSLESTCTNYIRHVSRSMTLLMSDSRTLHITILFQVVVSAGETDSQLPSLRPRVMSAAKIFQPHYKQTGWEETATLNPCRRFWFKQKLLVSPIVKTFILCLLKCVALASVVFFPLLSCFFRLLAINKSNI